VWSTPDSTLIVIFENFGAGSFSANFNLSKKMPKMPKIEVRLRRIDFIKMMAHSDSTILGILGNLAQFRHLMDFTIGT